MPSSLIFRGCEFDTMKFQGYPSSHVSTQNINNVACVNDPSAGSMFEPTPINACGDVQVSTLPLPFAVELRSIYGQDIIETFLGDDLEQQQQGTRSMGDCDLGGAFLQDDCSKNDLDSHFSDCSRSHCQQDNNSVAQSSNGSFKANFEPSTSLGKYSAPIDSWTSYFFKLRAYQAKNGHCNVSIWKPNGEETSLSNWVKRQRCQYQCLKRGKKSTMTASRIQMLESIGFEWDIHGKQWEERFLELVKYKQINGNCKVPWDSVEHRCLFVWTKRQKRLFKQSLLSADRIKRLERIGFVWKASSQSTRKIEL